MRTIHIFQDGKIDIPLFIKSFVDSAMKKSHPKGYKLFSAGDSADFFYILMTGSIRLSVGQEDKTTYLIEHAGESF